MKNLAIGTMHACAMLALTLAPGAVAARSASSLSNLVGARAAGGEAELERRDWVMTDGHKGGNGSYSYWWNPNRKDCVMVTTRDGKYSAITDATPGDCNQKGGGNDAAVGAAAAGAVIAAILLAHKSGHHDDGQHSDDGQKEAEYERGYKDGLHNSAYRNDSRNDSYSSGYRNGVDQRQRELGQGDGYDRSAGNGGGYGGGSYGVGDNIDVSDLVGAKAAGVESDLQSRGFRNVDGFTSGNDKGTIWWNARTRQCLQMITAEGRADSITDIQTHPRCR